MGGGSRHELKASVRSKNPVFSAKALGGYNLNLFIVAVLIVFKLLRLFGGRAL